jgi:6-phosphogluconolactonase
LANARLLNEGEGFVIAAHYGAGSVGVYPLLGDGRLGAVAQVIQHEGRSVNAERQEGPHAHGVTLDRSGRFLFVTDLGMDKVMVYRLDAGRLIPMGLPLRRCTPARGRAMRWSIPTTASSMWSTNWTPP